MKTGLMVQLGCATLVLGLVGCGESPRPRPLVEPPGASVELAADSANLADTPWRLPSSGRLLYAYVEIHEQRPERDERHEYLVEPSPSEALGTAAIRVQDRDGKIHYVAKGKDGALYRTDDYSADLRWDADPWLPATIEPGHTWPDHRREPTVDGTKEWTVHYTIHAVSTRSPNDFEGCVEIGIEWKGETKSASGQVMKTFQGTGTKYLQPGVGLVYSRHEKAWSFAGGRVGDRWTEERRLLEARIP